MNNNKELKFSVILPIFNVEKYLKECLDSIVNQTYKNLEIICVNDSSTDNSLKILEEYTLKDSRIKVINQPKQGGVATARNTGIENSTGDFISFIDPDDWVELNMFEDLNKYIEQNNPLILSFAHRSYHEDTGEFKESKFSKRMKRFFKVNILEKKQFSYSDFKKGQVLFYKDSSCTKVYSKEIFDKYNFRFPDYKNGEDVLFIRNILLHKIPIDCMKNTYYTYRKRPSSITTSITKYNTLLIFDKLDYIQNILEECNLTSELKTAFRKHKIRDIYEHDKKCLPEFKNEFMKHAKKSLTKREYCQFIFLKIISMILRQTFSIQKQHYVNNQFCNTYTILGVKINIPIKKH